MVSAVVVAAGGGLNFEGGLLGTWPGRTLPKPNIHPVALSLALSMYIPPK